MLACSFLIESSSKLLVTRRGIKALSSSILGRIRRPILELLALEWRKFHTFELEYLWSQLANLDQILCVASLGWGKGYIRFWGRLTLAHWTQVSDRCPLGYLFLIRSFSFLQVTRTCIKSRTSSNFGQIGPLTTMLAALERLKISHRLIMGKWCLHASSFIFDWIIFKVAGNQDRHKARTSLISGRIRLFTLELVALEWRNFYTFELKCLWSQLASLDQILCVASLGVGKGCIIFWDRLDQNPGVHGNRKPPLTYNGENGVSTFSLLLLIQSFFILAGNEDMHKILNKFEFWPDRTTD